MAPVSLYPWQTAVSLLSAPPAHTWSLQEVGDVCHKPQRFCFCCPLILPLKGRVMFICSPDTQGCLATSTNCLAVVSCLGPRQAMGSCPTGSTLRAGNAAWILMLHCVLKTLWRVISTVHCSVQMLLFITILLLIYLTSLPFIFVRGLSNKYMSSSKLSGKMY